MTTPRITRRAALKGLAAGMAVPFVFRAHAHAAPSETLLHASFGAAGMAGSDIGSLTAGKHLKLVAVADVDLSHTAEVKKKFPDVRVYQDWRELLDKEKGLHSVNVSTPDHMHGPITMRAMQQGLNVYTQKPLTQTIFEARRLREVAAEKKLVTQMGIQIHSAAEHRTVVATVQSGVIGKVKEVYSWSGKDWGEGPGHKRPTGKYDVPASLNWAGWLGVAPERNFIGDHYYHPGNWRKRLDFGTGTFGDMGCHILDPVFGSLALTAPKSVRSEGGAPNDDSWGLDGEVHYVFPGTKYTTDAVTLTWYHGHRRPPEEVQKLVDGKARKQDQGSIYVGTEGVLYSPYIAMPILLPAEKFRDHKVTAVGGENHYLQFVEACRGNGKTSAPFDYSGPLTESVLLGCLSTRFPKTTLEWDAAKLTVTNSEKANGFVRRTYRKGWEVEGM
jgi:predicted dehydrogenase